MLLACRYDTYTLQVRAKLQNSNLARRGPVGPHSCHVGLEMSVLHWCPFAPYQNIFSLISTLYRDKDQALVMWLAFQY